MSGEYWRRIDDDDGVNRTRMLGAEWSFAMAEVMLADGTVVRGGVSVLTGGELTFMPGDGSLVTLANGSWLAVRHVGIAPVFNVPGAGGA